MTDGLDKWRGYPHGTTVRVERFLATIDALLSQLREQETWHCTVEGRTTPCGTCDGCRWHISSLQAALREQRERAQLAEIERDMAQAQVRAKQSWIDGMKVDYDALNDEAHDHAHAAAIAESRAERAEAVISRLVAPDTWRWADGSEVGVPEGTFIRSGIAAALAPDTVEGSP